MRRRVFLTVDAEPDCPPYLDGWSGMEDGAPWLLDLLREAGVPATFFTTGEAARRHPSFVERLLDDGHELACHGMTHRSFGKLGPREARDEIERSAALLREHAPVSCFRAPYLTFPDAYLEVLAASGFRLDSSRGLYKPAHWRPSAPTSLLRVPVSMTSSWLRLPPWVRDPVLAALPDPVVLFVHPWEFVDLRRAPIPWDCRAGTGAHARDSLRSAVRLFREQGVRFGRMADLLPREREIAS